MHYNLNIIGAICFQRLANISRYIDASNCRQCQLKLNRYLVQFSRYHHAITKKVKSDLNSPPLGVLHHA